MTIQEAIKKLWLLRNKYECLTYQEAEKISITNAEFVDAIQMAIEALEHVAEEQMAIKEFENVNPFGKWESDTE